MLLWSVPGHQATAGLHVSRDGPSSIRMESFIGSSQAKIDELSPHQLKSKEPPSNSLLSCYIRNMVHDVSSPYLALAWI